VLSGLGHHRDHVLGEKGFQVLKSREEMVIMNSRLKIHAV
jgi:very-short-patch-repair endonuclease